MDFAVRLSSAELRTAGLAAKAQKHAISKGDKFFPILENPFKSWQSRKVDKLFLLTSKAELKGKRPVPQKTVDKAAIAEEKKAPTKATQKA